jgi:hypothetical protein
MGQSGDQSAGEAVADKRLVRVTHVIRNILGNGEPELGILDHPLEVADEHVQDELLVTDALEVVVQLQRPRRTVHLHLGHNLRPGSWDCCHR